MDEELLTQLVDLAEQKIDRAFELYEERTQALAGIADELRAVANALAIRAEGE